MEHEGTLSFQNFVSNLTERKNLFFTQKLMKNKKKCSPVPWHNDFFIKPGIPIRVERLCEITRLAKMPGSYNLGIGPNRHHIKYF
jgi:hypothetical protein